MRPGPQNTPQSWWGRWRPWFQQNYWVLILIGIGLVVLALAG